jgi:hypothetical protein
MVEEALKSMQQHLDAIQYKHVYDQLSPQSYLHTTEWRLKFLRSELFDCKMAAERLVRFTEYMHQEYDLEVLERPLKLEDLETKTGLKRKEVMKSFKSGHSQLLPFRDRSGRIVHTTYLKGKSVDSDVRVGCIVLFYVFLCTTFTTGELICIHVLSAHLYQFKISQYLWLVASEDEETQKNGLVLVVWGFGEGIQSPDIVSKKSL